MKNEGERKPRADCVPERPWKQNIAGYVHPGESRIEVLVYNTLANQYQTIPTRYRGSPESGLIGPVRIEY